MKMVVAIENSRKFCRLIGNTGSRKPSVSQVAEEYDDTLIHSQGRQLNILVSNLVDPSPEWAHK